MISLKYYEYYEDNMLYIVFNIIATKYAPAEKPFPGIFSKVTYH